MVCRPMILPRQREESLSGVRGMDGRTFCWFLTNTSNPWSAMSILSSGILTIVTRVIGVVIVPALL
jgi:hypothetical protein